MTNIQITEGTGKTIATESISSVEYQKVKLIDSTASSTTGTGVAANPLQVSLANTAANGTAIKVDGSAVTQPVSLTSTTITGTVAATQSGTWTVQPGNTANTTAWKVDGSAVTQPVSGSLTTVSTVTNLAQMNGVAISLNTGVRDTGTQRVTIATNDVVPVSDNSGSLTVDYATTGSGTATGALRVELPTNGTGVIATVGAVTAITNALPAGSALIGKVGLDQTTPGTTNAVSLAQIGGTTILNGGVAGSQSIGGTVATNVAINANPLNLGAQAVSSENSAVTTARQVQLVADLVGKLIVLPYSNPENFVSGAITSAMTGTTTTSLIAAPASGLRNYITQITVSNSHATVGTDVIIQDGSGGTTLYTIPAAAVYGGASITFPTPLRQPTTATAIYCANVTTGSSTKVSASGYKGV